MMVKLIEIKEIGTHINPEEVGAVWRTEKCRGRGGRVPRNPHGVVVVCGGYDRRAYFETEREREDAFQAVIEAIDLHHEQSRQLTLHVGQDSASDWAGSIERTEEPPRRRGEAFEGGSSYSHHEEHTDEEKPHTGGFGDWDDDEDIPF